jgi:hypothetical protein
MNNRKIAVAETGTRGAQPDLAWAGLGHRNLADHRHFAGFNHLQSAHCFAHVPEPL